MSRFRKSRNFLVPLALTATVAFAGLGMYLLLGNNPNTQTPSSQRSAEREVDDHITELDEGEPQQPKPRTKKKIAIVVREDALGLLWNLPASLNLATTDIFILVHSPHSADNPEKVYELVKDKFPRNYPREYIIPHTTKEALPPLLQHLAPEAVYMDESLVGEGGAVVVGLLGGNWVGSVIVVEDQGKGKGVVDDWEQKVQRFGRRCVIISKSNIRGDWTRRVG